ncbi:MAG: hypothetical protein AAF581_17090 [Planctomycetota bacterium]
MKFSWCANAMAVLLLSTAVSAQDYTITASSGSGLTGTMVTVDVTIDNIQPIRGFSFGLAHDSAVATLGGISEGSASTALNAGLGADFEHIDLSPVGGPGGIYGVVVSTDAPIEEIAAGTGQQIAQLSYTLIGGPGTSTALDFTGGLGNPPVATVLSVAGVSFLPVETSGTLTVEVPPVTGVAGVLDPCTCDLTVSWVDGTTYDSLTITVDGVVAANPTSSPAIVTLAMGATSQVCVFGTVNGQDSPDACISETCPTLPVVLPPTTPVCMVDNVTCVATITWTNQDTYTALQLTVDGVPQALNPSDQMATVNLVANDPAVTICVEATDGCGNALTPACCTAECVQGPVLTDFIRGDCNFDGAYNIADAVFDLNFLFSMGTTPTCLDACDCNDDAAVNIADAVCMLNGLFGQMTVPPAAPHPGCGTDPTEPDGLTCVSYAPCP